MARFGAQPRTSSYAVIHVVSVALLATIAFLPTTATASAAAAVPWSAPADVIRGKEFSGLTGAVDERGRGVVAWLRGNLHTTRLEVGDHRADGTLSAPVTLHARPGLHPMWLLGSGVDDDGGAAIVWATHHRLRADVRSRGGARFRTALDLRRGGYADLAVAPSGDVVMVLDGRSGVGIVAGRTSDRRFGRPRLLRRGDVSFAHIALAADGRELIAWNRVPRRGERSRIEVIDRYIGGRLGRLERIAGVPDYGAPSVALGAAGRAIVAWVSYRLDEIPDRTSWSLFAATRAPGHGFGPAERLDSGRQFPPDDPEVAMAPDGTATVAWLYPGGSEHRRRTPGAVRVATCPPAGPCNAARDLAPITDPDSAGQVIMADSSSGDRLIVWVDQAYQPTYVEELRSSFAPSGGDFGPIEEIVRDPTAKIDTLPGPIILAPGPTSRPQVFWVSSLAFQPSFSNRPRLRQAVRG